MRTAGIGMGLIITLSWVMVEFVQVSAEQGVAGDVPVSASTTQSSGAVSADDVSKSESGLPTAAAEEAHGPALTVPAEMIAMFQQRKQDLERRENAVRTAEGQLALLKAEVEKILTKVEAAESRRLEQEKTVLGQQASSGKQATDMRTQQLVLLAKMYESMPAEEAAARIEKMADRNALEILRMLKGKSAGAILAQVKVDHAAKLTEQLLIAPKAPIRR